MKMYKAPETVPDWESSDDFRIFLGGSIEMGAAEQWQERLANMMYGMDVVLLNPRRDDWDSTWEQDPTPGTKFYEQVAWELEQQANCDINLYYFAPGTKAPITLLELGLFSDQSMYKTIVCCPKEFWRYGNVAMVCELYDIQLVSTLEEVVDLIKEEINWQEEIRSIWNQSIDAAK